jgi:DNA modification methylase
MHIYDKSLNILKKELNFEILDKELISISLDISRVLDKKITIQINEFKLKHNIKLSAFNKKFVRDYILGLEEWKILDLPPIEKNIISENDILLALELINEGIKRNKNKVIGTIKSRMTKKNIVKENISNYLNIIKNYEGNKNQLLIIKAEKDSKELVDKIKTIIDHEYKSLSNYHNIVIIFENNSWSTISEIATYCEFFMIENNFSLFNKVKHQKITEFSNFIKNNKNINYSEELYKKINDFFSGVSYGFQFNDLLISDNDGTKILIMQKIELDENIFPCPDCMEKKVRGNSYPKVLLRSFECQNPNCPSRSKIGRGKRFDYFNVKRNLYLKLGNEDDRISSDLLKKFRKDIFSNKNDIFDMIIKFFSWSKNKIKYISYKDKSDIINSHNRVIDFCSFDQYKVVKHKDIELVKLFKEIISSIEVKPEEPSRKIIKEHYSIYEGNSSSILKSVRENISSVITSPPYYNAREYSQWPTLLCYLVDMAINGKSILEKIEDGGYYFYNIGDIVGQDNIFISSHMSNKRIMLGFYTVMLFQILGFDFLDNIIWNKGEVQSKRNSTENTFPSYIKPINCYEHVLIFGKNVKKIELSKKIFSIDPVKKINSKGENTLGHTAPYPEELVSLIFPFLDNSGGYILDPYLGSGTTVIAGYRNGIKTVGIEYNKNYFDLATKRILKTLT